VSETEEPSKAVGFVRSAVVERLRGQSPGRLRALIAAVLIGFAAIGFAYRFLRSARQPEAGERSGGQSASSGG
jgi:hypothetical protein